MSCWQGRFDDRHDRSCVVKVGAQELLGYWLVVVLAAVADLAHTVEGSNMDSGFVAGERYLTVEPDGLMGSWSVRPSVSSLPACGP